MTSVLMMVSLQALLGAFDNLWHHELQARLPQRTGARHELLLHALREAIYGVIFAGLAWWRWQGWCAVLLATLMLAECVFTGMDFLEEDRSRKLPPFERLLHTALAVIYGGFLGLFAPIWWTWLQEPTGLQFAPLGAWSWLLSVFAVGVFAWSIRNFIAVRQLRMRAAIEAPERQLPAASGPAVLVTGGTGFIGAALVSQLLREGRRVIVWTRDPLQARALLGPQPQLVERLQDLGDETAIDAVVSLAGAPVLGLPWTAARRKKLVGSRVETTGAVVDLMRRLHQRPRVLVSASAVGFYGLPEVDAPLDESAPPQPGRFQSDLCAAVEHEARRAEALGVRVVRLRFGIVLGAGGGAYPAQATAAKFGLGAILGSGRQALPWIHHQDALGLIRFAMATSALSGAVNAVAPQLPRQADFAKALAASFGRRVLMRMPAWPLRVALGEMSELLLEGQCVVPMAALNAGYGFQFKTLDSALQDLSKA